MCIFRQRVFGLQFVNNLSRDYGEPHNKKLKRRLERAFHYQIKQAMSAFQNPSCASSNANNNENCVAADTADPSVLKKDQEKMIEVRIRVWDDVHTYQLRYEDTLLWNIQSSNDDTCELFAKQLVKELALPDRYELRIAKIIREECLKFQLTLQNAPKELTNPIYYETSIQDIRHKLNISENKSGSDMYQFNLEGYQPSLFTHSYHHFQT
ncbi:hypothetical protein RFI_00825 [Reticulomyxa filosa]|uniref:Uncharacterized protein n=1 Tax=Reticulomyxa filosa TaxID=46433 RepID=X6PDQ7_RETFI|nr:hypothetical protein RFI_00825 [Reticulomyxa filosa]|eukprot:ETO36238.1 hypothetical protein RFI_00825 [Reticulomyxa filosa]